MARWITLEQAKKEAFGEAEWWKCEGPDGERVEERQYHVGAPTDRPIWYGITGTMYLGGWKDGKWHGFGVFYFQDGCVLAGNWDANNFSGRGKHVLLPLSPCWIENTWPRSVIQAQRPMTSHDDLPIDADNLPFIYIGHYQSFLMHDDKATVILKDGTTRVGPWKDNKPVGDWWEDHQKSFTAQDDLEKLLSFGKNQRAVEHSVAIEHSDVCNDGNPSPTDSVPNSIGIHSTESKMPTTPHPPEKGNEYRKNDTSAGDIQEIPCEAEPTPSTELRSIVTSPFREKITKTESSAESANKPESEKKPVNHLASGNGSAVKRRSRVLRPDSSIVEHCKNLMLIGDQTDFRQSTSSDGVSLSSSTPHHDENFNRLVRDPTDRVPICWSERVCYHCKQEKLLVNELYDNETEFTSSDSQKDESVSYHVISVNTGLESTTSSGSRNETQQILSIAEWLAHDVIGHNADWDEMKAYATRLVQNGFHSIPIIQNFITKDDVIKWMKTGHARLLLSRCVYRHDPSRRRRQLDSITRWLANDVIGHDADTVEMEAYAERFLNEGLHSVEMIQALCTVNDVRDFSWMKKFHKRCFVTRALSMKNR